MQIFRNVVMFWTIIGIIVYGNSLLKAQNTRSDSHLQAVAWIGEMPDGKGDAENQQATEDDIKKSPNPEQDKPNQDKPNQDKPDKEREVLTEISQLPQEATSIPKLLTLLSQFPTPQVIEAVFSFFNKIGAEEPQAITALLELAYHKDQIISNRARAFLLEKNSSWLINLRRMVLKKDYPHKRKAASLLSELGSSEIAILLKILRNNDKSDQEIAVEGLSKIGPDVISPLLALLAQEQSSNLYQNVFTILRNIGKKGVPRLVPSLTSENQYLSRISKDALVACGKEVVVEIVEYLKQYRMEYSLSVQSKEALQDVFLGIGLDVLPEILPLLSRDSLHSLAEGTLKKFGNQTLPFLLEAFKNAKTAEERQHALYGIASIASEFDEEQVKAVVPIVKPLLIQTGENLYPALRAIHNMKNASKYVVLELRSLIDADVWSIRLEAAYALANAGEDALPALSNVLKRMEYERYGDVKVALCKIISGIGSKASIAIPKLRDYLQHEQDEVVIKTAAEALGAIGTSATVAIPDLIRSLSLVSRPYRSTIAIAFAQIGPASLISLRRALQNHDGSYDDTIRDGVAMAIGYMGTTGKPAAMELLRALKFDVDIVRESAAFALGEIGDTSDRVVRPLLEACRDSRVVREAASRSLSKIGEQAIARIQIEILRTTSEENVKISLIKALGEMGSPTPVNFLVTRLAGNLSFDEKRATIKAIGKIGMLFCAGNFKASFIRKLRDSQDNVSIFVRENLSPAVKLQLMQGEKIPEETLVWEMNRLLQMGQSVYDAKRFSQVIISEETKKIMAVKPRGDELIRINRLLLEDAYANEITKTLIGRADTTIPTLIKLLREETSVDIHNDLQQIFVCLGSETIPSLITLLEEERELTQQSLFYILVKFGDKSKSYLEEKLRSENKDTAVINAMKILAEDSANIYILINASLSKNQKTSQQARYLVSNKFGIKAVPQLIEAMINNDDISTRTGIQETLVMIGSPTLPHVLRLIRENPPKKQLRKIAIDTISQIGIAAKETIPDLMDIFYESSDIEEQILIVRALGKMGADAIPHLAKLLNHENPEIRREVKKAFSATGSETAISYLLGTLKKDPDDLSSVVDAIVNMKDIAGKILGKFMQDSDTSIRFACAAALFEIADTKSIVDLERQLQTEKDPMVKYMLHLALKACKNKP